MSHNHTQIDLIGSIHLDIKIGSNEVNKKDVKFYVSRETLQTVLGGDFLQMQNSNVTFRKGEEYG